jgi:hypothetical protein
MAMAMAMAMAIAAEAKVERDQELRKFYDKSFPTTTRSRRGPGRSYQALYRFKGWSTQFGRASNHLTL